MALFHLHVTQVKRSAGQSVVTSAAYRAGEKLYSEYYGEVSDYTHKGGVVCTDILLPPQAPNQYQDRATLWNAVEKAERGKKAQLAYSFDIALQNEFSLEENIALARQFVSEQLVGRGMIADFAIHQPDKEDGGIPNPHFHVLCPIRPIEPDGKWGCKQRRRYRLDEDGNRIIMVDRKLLKNPNGLILGTPGSGKSFSSKREITNVFLVTEDDVLVCDPEDEYAPLVKRLGGQVVKISPTTARRLRQSGSWKRRTSMPYIKRAWKRTPAFLVIRCLVGSRSRPSSGSMPPPAAPVRPPPPLGRLPRTRPSLQRRRRKRAVRRQTLRGGTKRAF